MKFITFKINIQTLILLVTTAIPLHLLADIPSAPTTQKSVLFIPIDDLKPMLGCYGDDTIKTPNIDRLAQRGMVFLNNQCQQAVCAPSRASVMTGLYPDTTRIYDLRTRMRDMNPDILTLPEYFKRMGYETTGLGKTFDPRSVDTKLDEPSWSIPYSLEGHNAIYAAGYDLPVYAYQNPATKRLNLQATQMMVLERQKPNGLNDRAVIRSIPGSRPAFESMDVPDDAYADGARTQGALQLLEKLAAADKPFFLSVGYQKPHLPFVAPKKYWDLYDPAEIQLAEYQQMPTGAPSVGYQPGWELRGWYSDVPESAVFPEAYQRTLIHGYRASVSYIDAQVGLLLDKLDDLGIADDTVICLWSDHGWHLGDHNIWCKHSNFEQATRAPLIIAAASSKTKGQTTTALTEFVDIFPTLCDLSGLEIPAHLPGKSLVPLMDGEADKVKDFAISQYPRTPEGVHYMGYTLRDTRYRYIAWYRIKDVKAYKNKQFNFGLESEPAFIELYDNQDDPMETQSLADNPEHAQRIATYEQTLQEKIADIATHRVNDQ